MENKNTSHPNIIPDNLVTHLIGFLVKIGTQNKSNDDAHLSPGWEIKCSNLLHGVTAYILSPIDRKRRLLLVILRFRFSGANPQIVHVLSPELLDQKDQILA